MRTIKLIHFFVALPGLFILLNCEAEEKNSPSQNPDVLFSKLFSNLNPTLKIIPEEGIGYDDPGHSVQDPSNVIKVGDTYYVWLSWRPLATNVYSSVIKYATSKDGRRWEQQGTALGRGDKGCWDENGVLTPYVAQANGRFYMFYTGTNKDFPKVFHVSMGLAVADSPAGPWERVSAEPILAPTPGAWDGCLADDAHLLVRDGTYWLYYKGRKLTEKWFKTRNGVAFADHIEGPYEKYEGNPIIDRAHCVCVWPHKGGVAAIADLSKEILWAEDGLNFVSVKKGLWAGAGPGPYDPDAHTGAPFGRGITWGVMQFKDPSFDNKGKNVIARFELDLSASRSKD